VPRIIAGDPGSIWFNDTGIVYWQLLTSLVNVCPSCFSRHLQIAEDWDLPFHRACRCSARAVFPGNQAFPFTNYVKLLEHMTPQSRADAVGKSNWRLIKAGLVDWPDIVTATRVIPLHLVVAKLGLTVAALVAAGISRSTAEAAFSEATGTQSPTQIMVIAAKKRRRDVAAPTAVTPPAATIRNSRTVQREEDDELGLTPAQRIAAALAVLRRLNPNVPVMPDFGGSTKALRDWVAKVVDPAQITDADWATLLAVIAAQDELRTVFKSLGIDPTKGFAAIQSRP
jgi:hypothetical protein